MRPLITIETIPISIEYVEKKTTHHSDQSAKLRVSKDHNLMTIQSHPINIPLTDSFEPSSALGSSVLTYTATANYSSDGSLNMNVLVDHGEPNSYQYNLLSRGIDNIIDFVPYSSSQSSYGFESMQINFDMSGLSGGVPSADTMNTSFLPPDLELRVLERPKVIIKYVGGPLYIPRSADPNYVPPEEYNQIFDGKPIFEAKA